MSYSRRTWIAFIASCLLHLLLLGVGLRHVDAIPSPPNNTKPPPIIFNFTPPPEPEPVKQLVETLIPTSEEVAETDLISDKNSKAQDESEETGERLAPAMEEEADFDQLPTTPETQSPEKSTLNAVEAIKAVESTETLPPPTAPLKSIEKSESDNPSSDKAKEQPDKEETNPLADAPEKELPERIKIAAALEPAPTAEKEKPQPLSQTFDIGNTRKDGGTNESGVMNFEAKSHELGEYMLEVRRRVERQWYTALQLRYQGVKRAEATIECSIRPDGTLEYVRIKDKGNSMTFAIVCRDALQLAAPFPKLPIEVPEIYKSQNIEITWRFSYM